TELSAEGFRRGTLVKVPGGHTAIEDLKTGDLVISCDLDQIGSCFERKIEKTFSSKSSSLLALQVEEEELILDHDHQFYAPQNQNWVEAQTLGPDTQLLTADGHTLQVQGIEELAEDDLVYSISVEGLHNFYVTEQDILVHNWPPAFGGAIIQGPQIILAGGAGLAAGVAQAAPLLANPVGGAIAVGVAAVAVGPALVANMAPHIADILDQAGASKLGDLTRLSGGLADGFHRTILPSELRDFIDKVGRDFSAAVKEGRREISELGKEFLAKIEAEFQKELEKSKSDQGSVSDTSQDEEMDERTKADFENGITPVQRARINKIDNIIDNHATASDFSGVRKELQGEKIPNGKGGYFDHVDEMQKASAGLEKHIQALKNSLNNPNLSPKCRRYLSITVELGESILAEMKSTLGMIIK
ncbi:MAG: hypothetical protein KA436_12800, partial [Oligoflexales bacterium]|nr:hypothetical protein [Oligoflexales bacterium]